MNYTTAQPIVELKIERNRELISLLETQNIFLRNSILMQSKYIEANRKKIDLISNIIDLEDNQKFFYSLTVEEDIKYLTNTVNDIFIDIHQYETEINASKEKIINQVEKINIINSYIPDTMAVTNIKLFMKSISNIP